MTNRSYKRRPKIRGMTRAEFEEFNATYPLRVDFLRVEVCYPYGTNEVRKLMHSFFDSIGSQVASSGNKAYFTNQTDMDLFLMGMWR